MEMELIANGISEEDAFQVGDDNDGSTFESERCGICMDIIIDRGVLDCCQHWFCFVCIDNWATITNLCPLCQNEFQLITCVPVYDTIGSNKVDEDSFSSLCRDDDWCIEGKSNTLSFPSYYIDENAVVCLDGNGCKIRSGSATTEEDSNLDTSIACDSCDMWYHAFCVGFDPENTSESTWLCPRCVVDKVPQKSDVTSIQKPSNQCGPENADSECLVEAAFSGKVSVALADAGETAVVISMVGGNQGIEVPSKNFLFSPGVDKDQKFETFKSSCDANSPKVETSLNSTASIQPSLEGQGLELSLSRGTSFNLPPTSLVLGKMGTNGADKAMYEWSVSNGFNSSSRKSFGEFYSKNEPSESGSGIGLHLGLSVGSYASVDDVNNDGTEDQVAVGGKLDNSSEESFLSADKIASDATEDDVGITGLKRKHMACSDDNCTSTANGEIKAKVELETQVSAKKIRGEGKIQMIPSNDQASESVSNDSKKCPSLIVVSKSDELRNDSGKEDVSSDIMSIVQGTDHRSFKGLACSNPAVKSSGEGESAAGLRVKKIMRGAAEDKESSMLVQKLRKEIREAVHNKSSKDFGQNLFDPKLLAAFRAAVAGPTTEPAKKNSPLSVKLKKSMLQKGKIRENLTKKIYGTSNGRRRHAWDRDCEIEFWKHRCMGTMKPEKIETLKSVLDLLRNSSESAEIEQQSELQATNPILSRLYLADTSVFPRKGDIKPLSALKYAGKPEQNKEQHTLTGKGSKPSLNNQIVKPPETNHVSLKVGDNKGNKNSVPNLKCDAASSKVHPNRHPEGPSAFLSDSSKVNTKKEMVVKSDDTKSDKRKWALEVLARKTALTGRNATNEKQEDNAILKGNYPLLAQLPIDMRPVLAPSRHNKIPVSVRQAQLYRLTEHFLRKANLPFIRRTADTEFAVADAVNIEKDIADRTNSKLVYVNLCSQELLRRSDNNSNRAVESNPSSPLATSTEISEKATNELSSDPLVEEALRTAGLLSDSPPNSPDNEMKDPGVEDDPSLKIREGEPDNVFEMDSHPELDIYGDFEYDLEGEDYIGASAVQVSKLQPEGESRMKVVFSTLNSDISNDAQNFEDHERQRIGEVPKDSSCLLKCPTDTGFGNSTMEGRIDKLCCPLEPLGEGGEELSLAECEELYGPDKEPLIEKFPEGASRKLYGLVGAEDLAKKKVPGNNENSGSNQAVGASEFESESCAENLFVVTVGHNSSGGENSPNHSQTGENIQKEEKKPDTNTNKRSDCGTSVSKKVEAYIKEHIRPLCKSGVITAEQYRWAVAKTTDKVMKYHSKAKNASFLIKEGEKVKKLAEQYVETAQEKVKK